MKNAELALFTNLSRCASQNESGHRAIHSVRRQGCVYWQSKMLRSSYFIILHCSLTKIAEQKLHNALNIKLRIGRYSTPLSLMLCANNTRANPNVFPTNNRRVVIYCEFFIPLTSSNINSIQFGQPKYVM